MCKVHVVTRGKRWAVKKECNLRATAVYQDKQDAIRHAIRILSQGGCDHIIVHKADGSVESWSTYEDT